MGTEFTINDTCSGVYTMEAETGYFVVELLTPASPVVEPDNGSV